MKQIAMLNIIIYFKDESNDQLHWLVKGWLNEQGNLNRENGPAYISVRNNEVESEQWCLNGNIIRVK